MAITKPPVKPAWAETAANPADIVTPTDLQISAGWPASSTPPSRQRFNWILNYCGNGVRYFSRRGIVDYDAAETYAAGDIVRGNDGLLYESLLAGNINHPPSTSGIWWGSPRAPTPAAADNTAKIASTAFVQLAIAGKANTNGTYTGMTVGNATNAANAAIAATAGSVPWAGITGKPTTVAGFGITDAITTGNIGLQSVTFATTAGRARPRRSDNVNWDLIWSGAAGQPLWLVGSNDGISFFVYNPANFNVSHADTASTGTTQALGTSNTSLATTAFANPGALIATSGYQRLPSGVIMQWGRLVVNDIPGNPALRTGNLSFPIAFPTQCLNVQTTVVDANGDAVVAGVSAFNVSGFSWAIREIVGIVQNATLMYFAVGN